MKKELIFIIVLIIIIYFYINKKRLEPFCGTCTGPTAHMYKYGDPFYQYQNFQRKKYAKFPSGVEWMNLNKKERLIEEIDQMKLIDMWIHYTDRNEYGDPPHTKYVRENPLLDPDTGEIKYKNKYQYILDRYPQQPWMQMLKMIPHPL